MHNCLDIVLTHILLTSLRQPKEFNCLAAFPSAAIPIDHCLVADSATVRAAPLVCVQTLVTEMYKQLSTDNVVERQCRNGGAWLNAESVPAASIGLATAI